MKGVLESIAIINVARDILLLPRLVQRLRAQHGSQIHLYVGHHDQAQYFSHQVEKGLFDSINVVDHLMPKQFGGVLDEATVTETARRFEARYGETFNRLAVGHRHFGKGYALAGPYHPRSRQSEKTSYLEIVDCYNRLFEFWEAEIKNKGLTLLLNPQMASDSCVARSHQIPRRSLMDVRTNIDGRHRYVWAHNEIGNSPAIEKAYLEIEEPKKTDGLYAKPENQAELDSKYLPSVSGVAGFAKASWDILKNHALWRISGSDKAKVYYARSEVVEAYRRWRAINYQRKPWNVRTAAQMRGKRFVYFPLAVEPEWSFMEGSPEYFYQHAAIAAVSRDLPAGILLAVREHTLALGRRPSGFYRALRDLKNVVLLDLSWSGIDVVRNAEAVVTIRGSSGHEAAMMGKPVITFGRNNTYNFLPHVHVIKDESALKGVLADIVDGRCDRARAQRDGARFHQALVEVSFPYSVSWRDRDKFDEALVERVYETLVESLCDDSADSQSSAA